MVRNDAHVGDYIAIKSKPNKNDTSFDTDFELFFKYEKSVHQLVNNFLKLHTFCKPSKNETLYKWQEFRYIINIVKISGIRALIFLSSNLSILRMRLSRIIR